MSSFTRCTTRPLYMVYHERLVTSNSQNVQVKIHTVSRLRNFPPLQDKHERGKLDNELDNSVDKQIIIVVITVAVE